VGGEKNQPFIRRGEEARSEKKTRRDRREKRGLHTNTNSARQIEERRKNRKKEREKKESSALGRGESGSELLAENDLVLAVLQRLLRLQALLIAGQDLDTSAAENDER
jgi:hypothetical protein